MEHLHVSSQLARIRQRELQAQSVQARLLKTARGADLTLVQRLSRLIGIAFVHLGTLFLRYGRAETHTLLHHKPQHDVVTLN